MLKRFLTFFGIVLLFNSCDTKDHQALTAFGVYCEMVANDAKPVAFHYPMHTEEVNALWNDFEGIAQDYDVALYREENLPNSLLFPDDIAKGKEVVLIYKGNRLHQYLQWKEDALVIESKDFKALEANSRRLGRLLGYSPKGINELLRKNSAYRDLTSFKVKEQTTHLYYADLEGAISFYKNSLGLHQKDSSTFQISSKGYIQLHPFDEKHTIKDPKSTAIALLTDELASWYAHVQREDIPIKYTYKPRVGGPHDGFVAIDPGGYLLEFEQFKQHPENELFMAVLSTVRPVKTKIADLDFHGTITWTYHDDMLKMQRFYEQKLGYELVADQGWTKIYQTTNTTFIGLVDEKRGMEDYADQKAVELEWKVSNFVGFRDYAKKYLIPFIQNDSILVGPERYTYRISPENQDE